MNIKSIVASGLIGLLALTGMTTLAMAQDHYGHPAFASVAGPTSVPIGHHEYCQRRSGDCQAFHTPGDRVNLTDAKWADLQAVNNHYNVTVTPASDQDLYGAPEFWTYPVNGYGDCEDIVIGKRAALIERGWDASNLLITVVSQPDGEGHAVLMVRTDRGDLVLDNQDSLIKIWTDTPYTYLKRQSQTHAGQWVDILDARGEVAVTAGY
ncbi:transglutaminase-like cysteine peptidase [Pelagibacterium montanilacus]|uniref:transglutaminase-like cysteine peptidase n=1 Tax=Pelagibacterium montanilacus TaxID=2185280 RepID=UPI000F8D9822|nr:transglutaminase-like cysteine peptidase [Pelagibacterium montanilacus]